MSCVRYRYQAHGLPSFAIDLGEAGADDLLVSAVEGELSDSVTLISTLAQLDAFLSANLALLIRCCRVSVVLRGDLPKMLSLSDLAGDLIDARKIDRNGDQERQEWQDQGHLDHILGSAHAHHIRSW